MTFVIKVNLHTIGTWCIIYWRNEFPRDLKYHTYTRKCSFEMHQRMDNTHLLLQLRLWIQHMQHLYSFLASYLVNYQYKRNWQLVYFTPKLWFKITILVDRIVGVKDTYIVFFDMPLNNIMKHVTLIIHLRNGPVLLVWAETELIIIAFHETR